MHEQEMTWGWTMRIWLGVLWRWLAASTGAAVALAGIAVIGGRISGHAGLEHDPIFPKMLIAIWLLLFVWDFRAALRSKHGRFRIALVSADGISAFD